MNHDSRTLAQEEQKDERKEGNYIVDYSFLIYGRVETRMAIRGVVMSERELHSLLLDDSNRQFIVIKAVLINQ